MNAAASLGIAWPRTGRPAMVRFFINKSRKEMPPDVNECLVNNGDCSQLCRNEEGGRRCECFAGYTLGTDGRTCVGEYVAPFALKSV